MRSEIESHKLVLGFIAAWIVLFIGVLFLFHAHWDETRVEAEVILVLTLTVAAALGYVGTGEIIVGAIFGPAHRREFITYLLLGSLSLISGLFLAVSTDDSLKLIALLVAPHALLFGLALFRLSRAVPHHAQYARALVVCGAAELLCGFALAGAYWLTDARIVSLLGLTAVVSLLQLIPFLFFKPSHHTPASA
jgi:hypothetical protein